MLENRSALAEVLARGGRDGADGKRTCRMGECAPRLLIQAAGFAPAREAFEAAAAAVLGAKPPPRVGIVLQTAAGSVLRTGPEQIWIVADEASGIAGRLAEVIAPDIGAVTDLSHSRTRIFIEGPSARGILAESIALDLDPEVFAEGCFALTGLHHTPVLLLRSGPDRYEIWALRTFGESVFEWLADSALSAGYNVAVGAARSAY